MTLISRIFLLAAMVTPLCSCVHEWPEPPEVRPVTLTISHELPWSLFDYTIPSRGTMDTEGMRVAYTFEVYPKGTSEVCVSRRTILSDDIMLPDLNVTLDIPSGEYDIWIWSDFVDPASLLSPYYDSEDFNAITLREPYVGDTYRKDAFQGMVSVNIPASALENLPLHYDVNLSRPLTAYAFIATDVEEFIEQETRRKSPGVIPADAPGKIPSIDFKYYKAKVSYTAYLANEYSIFRNKPVDSALGISFEGELEVTDKGEILIAFDTFFINGEESTASLAIEIFDMKGARVAAITPLTIPTQRNRATIIRGPFLTSQAAGGVDISTKFDGEFNIRL